MPPRAVALVEVMTRDPPRVRLPPVMRRELAAREPEPAVVVLELRR
jgi:hypothetical protein